MQKTGIEWVKNPDGTQGSTWNPITGCLNGCEYCYARKLANGRLKSKYLANDFVSWVDKPFDLEPKFNPFHPRFWSNRLNPLSRSSPYGDMKPRGIFACDMSDLFGIGVPEDWTRQVLEHIKWCSQHRFYLLTKQPQNLAKFSPFPDNCWVGVTVTNDKMMNDALYWNKDYDAKIKFLSFEPLLERIDKAHLAMYRYNWVIIGAQTKPYKPPKWEWVSEIIDACTDADIPYFLKNNMEKVVPKGPYGGDLIQEMPK